MAEYKRLQYLLMATDPVHIGTGGYRLGRVDNSVVREPGTRVPKIPGTSLHGAARSYAAQLYEHPEAAGQDQSNVDDPQKDPVCYTFGCVKKQGGDEKTEAYSGVVNVFDAHILFFPVHSMRGPVWVTTFERLDDANFKVPSLPESSSRSLDLLSKAYTSFPRAEPLSLGWIMVEVKDDNRIVTARESSWERHDSWTAVKDHIVIVQEQLFSHVVNSNLEVRTSVAIDPKTGAAVDKALFSYEAIPRSTFLICDVVLDDYRNDWPLKNDKEQNETKKEQDLPGKPWDGPLAVLSSGFKMIEWLGVGGMGTRGFGRLAMVGDARDDSIETLFNGDDSHE